MKEQFDDWWDAPIDMTGNPFRQDCAAYWAWAGWVAGAAAERNAILQMSREQWFKTQADFEGAIRAREST